MNKNVFISEKRIQGKDSGPLSGLTFVVKDFTAVEGLPLTYGLANPVADRSTQSSAAVRLLLDLGAILLGTTNLDPGALGYTGKNPYYGNVEHPWDDEASPLGSSSGAAYAVATNMCDFALTSDLAGSTRLPAAACKLYGLKLSPHALQRDGSILYHDCYDCFGLLSKEIETLELILKNIQPQQEDVSFDTFFIPHPHDLTHCEKGVLDSFHTFLAAQQQDIEQLEADIFSRIHEQREDILPKHIRNTWSQYGIDEEVFGDLGTAICERAKLPDGDNPQREELEKRFTQALEHGVIVTPSLPVLTPDSNNSELNKLLFAANMCGCPAITIPYENISLQFIAAPGAELALVDFTRSLK